MEQFNPLDNQSGSQNFTLSREAIDYIESGSKWAKFLSVLGFITTGMITLMMLGFTFVSGMSAGSPFGAGGVAAVVFMVLIYGSIIAIYFFTSLYLYKFADKLSTAVRTQSNSSFEEGFVNYKRLFKMTGILALITIAFYILSIISFLIMDGFGSFPID